ncbi:hypothetical protein D3C72_857660 [compost metagenome]
MRQERTFASRPVSDILPRRTGARACLEMRSVVAALKTMSKTSVRKWTDEDRTAHDVYPGMS